MAKLELDIFSMGVDFFADVQIFAIATSGMKDHRFCWLLNETFGINLHRNPEFDILLAEEPLKKQNVSLFDQEVRKTNYFYFPLYSHKISLSESSIYLYNNRCEHKYLIPEYKQTDFFLFVPNDFAISKDQFFLTFQKIKAIQWVRELDWQSIKSSNNFIF